METPRIQKFSRYKIQLTKEEKDIVFKVLDGELTYREAGEKLGLSHQGVINFTLNVVKQMWQSKELQTTGINKLKQIL